MSAKQNAANVSNQGSSNNVTFDDDGIIDFEGDYQKSSQNYRDITRTSRALITRENQKQKDKDNRRKMKDAQARLLAQQQMNAFERSQLRISGQLKSHMGKLVKMNEETSKKTSEEFRRIEENLGKSIGRLETTMKTTAANASRDRVKNQQKTTKLLTGISTELRENHNKLSIAMDKQKLRAERLQQGIDKAERMGSDLKKDFSSKMNDIKVTLSDMGEDLSSQLDDARTEQTEQMNQMQSRNWRTTNQLKSLQKDMKAAITKAAITQQNQLKGIQKDMIKDRQNQKRAAQNLQDQLSDMQQYDDDDDDYDDEDDYDDDEDYINLENMDEDEIQDTLQECGNCPSNFPWIKYNEAREHDKQKNGLYSSPYTSDAKCDSCQIIFNNGEGYICNPGGDVPGTHYICNMCIQNHYNQGGGRYSETRNNQTIYVLGNRKLNLGQIGGSIDKFYNMHQFTDINSAKKGFQQHIKTLGTINDNAYHHTTVLNKSKNGIITNMMTKKVTIPKKLKYHYITNPKNGEQVYINSNSGRNIINTYLSRINEL